ncbi:hypothetical protein [Shewanella woodyi]|uniref:cyanobactin maturation protease PatG family protein n=1 Tax=Shewanella woodyi TaxID=60961 RepID=UPI0037497A94
MTRQLTHPNIAFNKHSLAAQSKQVRGIEPAHTSVSTGLIYVVGSINALFSSLSMEQEFIQASITDGETVPPALSQPLDQVALEQYNNQSQQSQWLYKGLSQPQNLYIAREMMWTLENTDSNQLYNLLPTSSECLLQLIIALSPETGQVIVVGNLTENNVVAVSKIVAVGATPLAKLSQKQTNANSFTDLIDELLSLNANNGGSDADRGLNYALYNNPSIYLKSYELCYQANASGPNPSGYQLVNVKVQTKPSGDRIIAKVIFDYQGINTGATQSWYCAVDVTGEYPFISVEWKQFLCHH